MYIFIYELCGEKMPQQHNVHLLLICYICWYDLKLIVKSWRVHISYFLCHKYNDGLQYTTCRVSVHPWIFHLQLSLLGHGLRWHEYMTFNVTWYAFICWWRSKSLSVKHVYVFTINRLSSIWWMFCDKIARCYIYTVIL